MEIKLQKVDFKYNDFASKTLENINLNINQENEFIFLVGQTGSGKSTLVQLLNALLLPNNGYINVFNKDVVKSYKKIIKLNTNKNQQKYDLNNTKGLFVKPQIPVFNEHLKEIRKEVGLVFQFPEYQLFESTVLDDVTFGPKNYGLSKDDAYREAKYVLRQVGLDSSFDELSPFTLSGGEMRRVAIAGIIACNPKLLILDEPTVGLDSKGKKDLMNLLHKIQEDTKKSIIIISHDMDIVAEHAKRVIVLNNGNIVFDGDKNTLFNNNDLLNKYHLGLPNISKTAVVLKEKGLINYKNVPLSIEDLKKCILGGIPNE